jgi:Ser/Thr protein kinase RdoA (MazF antagonist)
MKGPQDFVALIDEVLDRRSTSIAETLLESEHTTVYKTSGQAPYVVRVSSQVPEQESQQMEMLQRIGDLDGRTTAILYTETREIRDQVRAVSVMTYLPGRPLDHYPSPAETHGILKAIHALHARLRAISPWLAERGTPRLEDILAGLIAVSEPSPMTSHATALIENDRFSALLTTADACPIYGDPWPSNFLIDDQMPIPRVRIVDIDPVFFGPPVLQPAVLFAACFVASSLLYPTEGSKMPDLDALIGAWPEPLDRHDVLMMMRVFPVLLSLFKVTESKRNPSGNPQLLRANLDLLERCLAVIDTYGEA